MEEWKKCVYFRINVLELISNRSSIHTFILSHIHINRLFHLHTHKTNEYKKSEILLSISFGDLDINPARK